MGSAADNCPRDKEAGLSAGFEGIQSWLEIKTQSKLGHAVATVIAPGRTRRAEIATSLIGAAACARCRVQEVRMIEQVEEVGLECHPCPLIHLECLGYVEIDVLPVEAVYAVPVDWSITPQTVIHIGGVGKKTPQRGVQKRRNPSPRRPRPCAPPEERGGRVGR